MLESEPPPRSPRAADWPLIGRWWDQGSVGAGAALALFAAPPPGGYTTRGTHGNAAWWWLIGGLVFAAGLGIRAARLDADPRPSRMAVVDRFVSSWLTWRVLSIAALAVLVLVIVLFGNKPWDPLGPCSRVELGEAYTANKCLARTIGGRIVPYEVGRGTVVVRDSGDLNTIDYSMVEPSITRYTWAYRPVSAWVLTIVGIGGLALSIHLRGAQRQRAGT